MTDYLEGHLDNADALLERVKQLERGASGLPYESSPEEKVDNLSDSEEKTDASEAEKRSVSEKESKVDVLEEKVDRLEKTVDKSDSASEILENEAEFAVNRKIETEDDTPVQQSGDGPSELDTQKENVNPEEIQSNAEKAENSVPLADQLEELDRAVSALPALAPEGRQEGYPVSLPGPRSAGAYPGVSGMDGGGLNGLERSVGFAAPSGAGQSWAEQADRVFRRDSRRYDGGFYLY